MLSKKSINERISALTPIWPPISDTTLMGLPSADVNTVLGKKDGCVRPSCMPLLWKDMCFHEPLSSLKIKNGRLPDDAFTDALHLVEEFTKHMKWLTQTDNPDLISPREKYLIKKIKVHFEEMKGFYTRVPRNILEQNHCLADVAETFDELFFKSRLGVMGVEYEFNHGEGGVSYRNGSVIELGSSLLKRGCGFKYALGLTPW